jgi:hypothetical protein
VPPVIKKVLITVKTYPNPSKKYVETVCCAGIDLDTSEWIRLYPIPFRDLDESKKFKKYTIIEVKCWKSNTDHRVESYKIDSDSIKIVDWLDTKNGWEKRKNIVLPTVSKSLCQIISEGESRKSLGMFKPTEVSFSHQRANLKDRAKHEQYYAQLSFFDKKKDAIEEIPFDFYYHFKCVNESSCPGHKLPILDWEIGQSYRNWRFRYEVQEILLQKIEQKWLEMTSPQKDVYFFVGNIHRFQNQFMILGVFYPPK